MSPSRPLGRHYPLTCARVGASARGGRSPVRCCRTASLAGPSDEVANAALVAGAGAVGRRADVRRGPQRARRTRPLALFAGRASSRFRFTRDAGLLATPPKRSRRCGSLRRSMSSMRSRFGASATRSPSAARRLRGRMVALGAAMFGAATILSAHAPAALRVVFDGGSPRPATSTAAARAPSNAGRL